MSATTTAILERVSPPASIRNLPQLIEVRHRPGTGPAAIVADPTPMLREALDALRIMQEQLAALAVESDQDRAIMRESAADTEKVARLYYDLHSEMLEAGLPKTHPVVAMCEEIAVGLEDVAETAALAGSKAFAQAVMRELAVAGAED